MDVPLILWAISVFAVADGLVGPNICNEVKPYTITTRIKYQQPVSIKAYEWCLNIPPRCSVVRTEMREKWKVQSENRSKIITFCCPGFGEGEDRCVPKCPTGKTGDKCDEDCPPNKWGTSCHRDCKCPKNSVCDSKNGVCICIDGWIGASCDLLKSVLTTRTPPKKTLFDWSTPQVTTTSKPSLPISQQPLSTRTTTIRTTTVPTTTERTTIQETGHSTTQIESPVTTPKPKVKDSPITIIQKSPKEFKPIPKATESSIISLTVLKSTATTAKRKVYKPKQDSELVKITLNSGARSIKSTPSDLSDLSVKPLRRLNESTTTPPHITKQPFTYTSVSSDGQTEEIMHVLTEPEQITSIAGDEDIEDRNDGLYSVLSVAMGIAAALILVATIIVLVARYRRGTNERIKMDMNSVKDMMSVSEEELPSGYMRSVFHNTAPDFSANTLPYIPSTKPKCPTPFMRPVVIHAISPLMIENFRDILECHYDHPKPPRPTNMQCLPVTEESVDALKLEHAMQSFELESVDPVYDEIPWPPLPARANRSFANCDEAVTEL